MAFINLTGVLLDPNGESAVGDRIKFTHNSNTGSTLKGAVSEFKIPPNGSYNINLEYGLVLVEYKDVSSSQYKTLGVVTVNGTNPATNIPELLNAVTPASSAELIEFQTILSDAVTARDEAEVFAASLDLINDLSQAYTFKTVALMQSSLIVFPVGKKIFWQGYYAESDGGSNWGLVASGAHIDDGGSVFTLGNGDYISVNIKGKTSILKWGARDRSTGVIDFDCTTRLNAMFEYLDTSYVTNSFADVTAGGGDVFIPQGEYLTTNTVYMGSSIRLHGIGWASKFRFNPSVSGTSFLKPRNKYNGVVSPAPTVRQESNWTMKFEDFLVCTEPTGASFPSYGGATVVSEYNRNTLHCFDISDALGTSFERVMVTDFWQGTAYRIWKTKDTFAYYNQLNQCIAQDCKLDVQTISAMNIFGGTYSTRIQFPADTLGKEYSISIGVWAGTSLTGVGIEGNATVAAVLDNANGTSIKGCYIEAKKSPNWLDLSQRVNVGGGGDYSGNHVVYATGVLMDPVITQTGISNYTDGVKLTSGQPIEVKIVESTTRATPSFRGAVEGITNAPASGLFLQGTDAFISGTYYELRRGATSDVTDNQANYYFVPAEDGRGNEYTAWVTLMVKLVSEDSATIRVYNPTSGNRDMSKVVNYTNGWSMYGTFITITDGEASNLIVRQDAGSTSPSRKIQFSGLRVFQNGLPAIPCPYPYEEEASAAPTGGVWNKGERVWNSNPSGVGADVGWTNTLTGFKSMGLFS